jgi:hypothetical protein
MFLINIKPDVHILLRLPAESIAWAYIPSWSATLMRKLKDYGINTKPENIGERIGILLVMTKIRGQTIEASIKRFTTSLGKGVDVHVFPPSAQAIGYTNVGFPEASCVIRLPLLIDDKEGDEVSAIADGREFIALSGSRYDEAEFLSAIKPLMAGLETLLKTTA